MLGSKGRESARPDGWRRKPRGQTGGPRGRTVTASSLALALAATCVSARAADVEITANTGAVNLDTFTGTTARINAGVTVGPASPAISATLQPWTLTNEGAITGGNTVQFNQGGTFTNASGATVTGSATAMTFGYKPFGQPPTGGPGTVNNYGTITGGVEGVTMWFGGAVNNYAGGTITTATGLNAVSIGQGTSRSLFNSGTIQATKTTGYSTGVLMQGGPSTFTNTGTGIIYGDYNGVYGSASAVFTSFSNAGSIRSSRGPAVEATGGGAIANSGIIASVNSDGILTRNTAAAEVVNSGTISGAVNAINFTSAGGGTVGATHTVRLQTGSVLNGNVLGGTGTDNLILEGTSSETIAKFKNFETLSMQGNDWSLNGSGTFATNATVQSGVLHVNGQLTSPAVAVQSGGVLGGTGTIVGAVTNNGTIGAGNSIGTLSVQGSVVFNSGSTLQIEANSAGQADLLSVTGTTTINGGTVQVLAAGGTYLPSTSYTIIATTAGRTGTFSGVISNFAFLAPTLTYDVNNVYLTLERNSIDLDAIGGTPNQRATGAGLQRLGGGNAIFDAVLMLDVPGARAAFDALSGEIHASASGLLLDDSRFVREAALDRVRLAASSAAPGLWGQAYGAPSDRGSDGNAADFGTHSGGFFTGLDAEVADNVRLGVLTGYGRSTFDVDDRASSGSADSIHLAVYGGGQLGGFALRGGAAYAWQTIETDRSVAFPGFSDRLSAKYDGHTGQVFGEAGYAFHAAGATIEPTAALAYVATGSDAFSEDGGAAALTSGGLDNTVTFSTLGVRGSAAFDLGGMSATARGFLGWRHAFGDAAPRIGVAFAGQDPFTIAGTPIARDAALVDLGLDIQTSAASRLGIGYSGQFGGGTTSQAFKAGLHIAF